MGDVIKIEGVPGYDGEYPIDYADLTKGELRILQRVTHLAGHELAMADLSDIFVATGLATIALKRAGNPYWEGFDEASDKIGLSKLRITITSNGDGEKPDPPPPPSEPD